MKKNYFTFSFDSSKFNVSQTCKFYFDVDSTEHFKFIELVQNDEVYVNIGTKVNPGILTVYKHTFVTSDLAGSVAYVVLTRNYGNQAFFCCTFNFLDINEIISAFASQLLDRYSKVA